MKVGWELLGVVFGSAGYFGPRRSHLFPFIPGLVSVKVEEKKKRRVLIFFAICLSPFDPSREGGVRWGG